MPLKRPFYLCIRHTSNHSFLWCWNHLVRVQWQPVSVSILVVEPIFSEIIHVMCSTFLFPFRGYLHADNEPLQGASVRNPKSNNLQVCILEIKTKTSWLKPWTVRKVDWSIQLSNTRSEWNRFFVKIRTRKYLGVGCLSDLLCTKNVAIKSTGRKKSICTHLFVNVFFLNSTIKEWLDRDVKRQCSVVNFWGHDKKERDSKRWYVTFLDA